MADATYFERCQSSFTLLHGPQRKRISFSLIIPNAPTQGPPTSRAVQVNLESSVAVTNGANVAVYSYLANSSLVGQIVFKSNSVTRMTTSKQYDYLNRLGSIASTPSNAFTYQYNPANQRTMNQLADGSYWRYGYDALGQVTLGNKYWVDETIVAGQQFDYAFDTIGNRVQTQAGGDQNGANPRLANYTNNVLNQITSRSVPAAVDVLGNGLATNGVTVPDAFNTPRNPIVGWRDAAKPNAVAYYDSLALALPKGANRAVSITATNEVGHALGGKHVSSTSLLRYYAIRQQWVDGTEALPTLDAASLSLMYKTLELR